MSARKLLVDLFFLKLFSSYFADLSTQRYYESILRIFGGGYSNLLVSILPVFTTAFLEESSSWSQVSIMPRWKVLDLFKNINLKSLGLTLQRARTLIRLLINTPDMLFSQKLFLTGIRSLFWTFCSSCLQRLEDSQEFGKYTLNLPHVTKIKLFTSCFYLNCY